MIENIDVSKCEFYGRNDWCTMYRDYYGDVCYKCSGEECEYCYYRELERKTQEYEELKKIIGKIKKLIEEI